MTPSSPKITVVVPTYNEKENLPVLVNQLASLGLSNFYILVVDDSSPDGTGNVADNLAQKSNGKLSVLHRTEKNGLGRAYVAGMMKALTEKAEIVIQMDADLSHPVSVIPTMIERLKTSKVGLVIGSRYVPGGTTASEWPWHRKALSTWANFYVRSILSLKVKDATAGFKAWKATTLQKIDISTIGSNGYSFQVEMNYRTTLQGIEIAEVPIRFEERTAGSSKMNLLEQMESARTPWRLLLTLRSRTPQGIESGDEALRLSKRYCAACRQRRTLGFRRQQCRGRCGRSWRRR
ncbi:polyprenol monophosphomannose synthase [Paenarthrobacter sp. NPDC089989]|uniref:polyprenol monophosphomannose synthase n=1 Tax=unclassified Paenarthrobacter TaxID=2634190 RepID=UPI003801C970